MLNVILERPAVLAGTILVVVAVNYALASFVQRRGSNPRVAMPFITAVPVAVFSLFLDPVSREFLGGGYLVMQLAALSLGLGTLVWASARQQPVAVRPPEAHYRRSASTLFTLAVAATIIAVMFKSRAFAGGAAFLAATALGWYRRASQARQAGAH
jgi:hypothetical protein